MQPANAADATPPLPLLSAGKPVDGWFDFQFNGKDCPGCGAATVQRRACLYDSG